MRDALTVSVVIVSRDRPDALCRCVTALSQQLFGSFELVIVADEAGLSAVQDLEIAASAKLVPCEDANISAARNLGISAAAGEIIAFIDDDSVPEPTWLRYLTEAFARPEVLASGGFVRGRNGISWQSRASWVDVTGQTHPFALAGDRTTLLTASPGRAIKTEGTNMAVRRDWLASNGGFDPRFRFFLDETDINMRLAAEGAVTAVAPLAQVHHGFAASDRRTTDRVPVDLTEIGASWSVFLDKHCPQDVRQDVFDRVRRRERRRLVTHMVQGGLEPRDVGRLMAGLEAGFKAGAARTKDDVPDLPLPAEGFRPFADHSPAISRLSSGRIWSRAQLHRQAETYVDAGDIVTVMRFSPTTLYHRIAYEPPGYWEHTGGFFGRSIRSQPLFRYFRFADRVKAEAQRVRVVRGLPASTEHPPRSR